MGIIGGNWEDDVQDDRPLLGRSWVDDNDHPNDIPIPSVYQLLDQMIPQERMVVFGKYCQFCGHKQEHCQCL